MIVHVTAEHIAKGWRCDALYCPVAFALHAAGLPRVSVYTRLPDCVILAYQGRQTIRLQDAELHRRIDDYDEGGPMEPFSFTLPD